MCSTHEHTSHAASEKVKGTTFKVAEMSCGHCVGTIRKAFDQMMPGVGVGIDLDKLRSRAMRLSRQRRFAPRAMSRSYWLTDRSLSGLAAPGRQSWPLRPQRE